jgi:hypothetical protein
VNTLKEYKVVEVNSYTFEDKWQLQKALDECAKDGWSLVSTNKTPSYYTMIWERDKPDNRPHLKPQGSDGRYSSQGFCEW